MLQDQRIRESQKYLDRLVEKQINSSRTKTEYILELYSSIGFIVFGASIVYVSISLLPINLDNEQRIALYTGFFGFLVALLSRGWVRFRRAAEVRGREEREHLVTYFRLFDAWTEFEEKIRSILDPDESSGFNIRQLIMDLKRFENFQDYEIEDIQRALYQRNKLMHGPRPYATDDIDDAIRTLEAANAKLEMIQPNLA